MSQSQPQSKSGGVTDQPALKPQTSPDDDSNLDSPLHSIKHRLTPVFALSTALSLISAGFCLGVLTLAKLPELSLLESGFLLIIALGIGLVFKSRKSLIAVLIFAGFLLGVQQIECSIDHNLSARLWLPQTVRVIAISTGLPEKTSSGYRQQFTLMGHDPESTRIRAHSAQHKLLIYMGNSSEQMAREPLGQWYQLKLKLNPIRSSASPAFSQEKWLLAEQLAATGYLLEVKKIAEDVASVEQAKRSDSLLGSNLSGNDIQLVSYRVADQVFLSGFEPKLGWLERINLKVNQHRMNLRQLMLSVQPSKPEASGLSLSLLTGDRGVLDPKITELYRHFGISHLLAISGPHVLFAALVFSVLLKLLLNLVPLSYRLIDRASWIAPGAIMAAGAYAWLSGLDVPALRTLIMFALAGAGLRVRSLGIAQILVLCAAIILLLRPLSVFEVGFWLSLAGVSALMMISRMSTRLIETSNSQTSTITKLRSLFGRAVIVQAMIFALLLPITLGFFGEFSYLAIPANLIAVAVIGLVVVPLNLLGYLLLALSPELCKLIFTANIWLIDQFDQLLFGVQKLTPNALVQSDWGAIDLLIALVALIVLLVFTGRAKLIGLLLMLAVLAPKEVEPDQLVVFDGLSFTATALISANQTPWLVISDLPKLSAKSEKNLAYEISTLSQQLKLRSDTWRMIVSQTDQSASWQQLIALMPELQVNRVISNQTDPAAIQGILSSFCESGTRLVFGDGVLEILAPWGDLDTGNQSGCVIGWRKDNQELALLLPDKATTSLQILAQMCLLPEAKVTVFPASTPREVLDELKSVDSNEGWWVHALSFNGQAPNWSWQTESLTGLSEVSVDLLGQNQSLVSQSSHFTDNQVQNAHLINLRESGQISAVFTDDQAKLRSYRAGKPWLSVTQHPSNTP